MKECLNKEKNKESCVCIHEECERKGVCCECIAYHRARDQKPACLK